MRSIVEILVCYLNWLYLLLKWICDVYFLALWYILSSPLYWNNPESLSLHKITYCSKIRKTIISPYFSKLQLITIFNLMKKEKSSSIQCTCLPKTWWLRSEDTPITSQNLPWHAFPFSFLRIFGHLHLYPFHKVISNIKT